VVPAWIAVAAWLACWSALAWISMGLLRKVRPGETVPMQWGPAGTPNWRAQPWVAAAFTPALATVLGIVTIGVGYWRGQAQAPVINLVIAAGLVVVHALHMRFAVRTLERERGER